MTDKNFLNFHVLISHSPSCLNRDDMNMQKSAIFGGVRRVRVSSQSLKRAIRKSGYYLEHLGKPAERTRQLGRLSEKYAEALKDKFEKELVIRTIQMISGKEELAADTQADALAPWSLAEVERYCSRIQELESEGTEAKKIQTILKKESISFLEALRHSKDIALSGRMATSGLMTSIDGSLSVAHAITTHAVDADIDWFTAVDDLVTDEGDIGAGHLNTQEFSAGVFYRYASLNIRQLQENLGNIPRAEALSIGKHVLRMMAVIVPSAKQNTFAAHNPADFVMASFSDMPLSLANAFEEPVQRDRKSGGFLIPSILKLNDYWTKIYQGYGLEDRTAAFSLRESGFSPCWNKLSDLEKWIEKDGNEGDK
ncbi:MAG: type I-E CRISPR-associated protein Cas7/Cse4/CasC [Desulfococcaceae bacterium]|jgi:CRISPR system Cascade subunit CasC|nr:type I-E CRISPR-associated protein Cas7/Cse4/CasC [Desulfococcaceae bacterium]